ncbi:hypothetical protein LZ318_30755 [Saccharopolyspora indica]|uniref:hypothetical protein n=1 Tax=Saccharopolyspora indica TaxID=1229659 RepID=UPI0022EAD24A|nr:hypothetical protein [Saccharopolyspora indica]MDA3644387.1 hypothetical protein [Saccharopolyspora indica]
MSADTPELATLAKCGRILSAYPLARALPRLRELWHRSDAQARQVIEACAPDADGQPAKPEPAHAPRWDRAAIEQARARAAVHTRTDRDQIRPRRAARTESRAVRAYFDGGRVGVDDQPRRDEVSDGYAVDYDEVAVSPTVRDRGEGRGDTRRTPVRDGRPCVVFGCNVFPSVADRAHRDGLCEECRELGRPGIAVPDGATRTEMIEALCGYLAEHYPHAREHLRREWQRFTAQADRDTVAAWVTANLPDDDAESAPGCPCGGIRQVRNGLCVDCRQLDTDPTVTAAIAAVTASAGEQSEKADDEPAADDLAELAADEPAELMAA